MRLPEDLLRRLPQAHLDRKPPRPAGTRHPPACLLWRQLVHRLPSVECLVRPGWTTVEGTRVSASGSQRGADVRLQHTDTPAHTNLSEKGWILPFSPDWCVLVCRNPATCCGVRLVQHAAGREAGSVQCAGGLRRSRLVACTGRLHTVRITLSHAHLTAPPIVCEPTHPCITRHCSLAR